MKTKFSSRDWELLSEYLDQQLHPNKRSKLELRLQRDANLRAALEELRHTRAILRSAPRLKAPRSFALKPHMVPQKSQRRIYPVFQFASALASVLFVLVLVGDLLGVGIPTQAPMLAGAPAPAAESQIIQEEESMRSLAVPAEEGPSESAERQIIPPEELPEPSPPSIMLFGTPEALPAEPQPTAQADEQPFEKFAPLAPDESDQAYRVEVPEEMLDTSAAVEPQQPLPSSTWRALQVSFALLALISGAFAIYLRRVGH